MKEVVVFLDEPAEDAIRGAVAFLIDQGVTITDRSNLSVAFAGSGQLAAVPVQLRPSWCRVWATAWESDAALAVIDLYAASQRERSRRVEAEVKALEAEIYSDASWPTYAEKLRASLQRAGTTGEEIDRRLATLKQRWMALGRRAAAAPEEHLSA